MVDPCYIQALFSVKDIQRWHDFLAKLGVLDFLAVKHEVITITADKFVSEKLLN